MRGRRLYLFGSLAVAAALVGIALAVASSGDAKADGRAERDIYLTAVEWKGSAKVADEPFPTDPLPEGGGYELVPPDAAGTWGVETYRFDSAVVNACRGERVTLHIFGVNSRFHDISIPNFRKAFRVERGKLSTTSFVVKKTGIFPIICLTHQPSHRADLVVLPC